MYGTAIMALDRARTTAGFFSSWTPLAICRALLVAHLFASPLVFWRGAGDVFEFVKFTALLLVAILCIPLAFWSPLRLKLPRISNDPVSQGVILFAASAFISTIRSDCPRLSWYGELDSHAGLLCVFGYVVLFLATRIVAIQSPPSRLVFMIAVVAAGGIAALYSLIQSLGLDPFTWSDSSTIGTIPRPLGTLGHPNHLAGYLVGVAPISAELARRAWGMNRRLLSSICILVLVLSVCAIVLSLSRGAWLALVVGTLVLGCGWFALAPRRVVLCLLGLLPVALAVGAFVVSARTDLVDRAFESTASNPRHHLWRSGWAMFESRPFLGHGLDTFGYSFQNHRTPDYWALEWNATPAKAHNTFIQLLATQGVLGALAVAVVAFGVIRCFHRSWLDDDSPNRYVAVATIAAIAGLTAHGLLSFTVIATGALMVTLIGLLSSGSCRVGGVFGTHHYTHNLDHRTVSRGRILTLRLIAVSLTALALHPFIIRPWRAALACGKADQLVIASPRHAVKHYQFATQNDPGRTTYWTKLSAALHISACSANTAEERWALIQESESAARQGLALEPHRGTLWADLARVLAAQSSFRHVSSVQAFAAFDEALTLDPSNGTIYQDAANAAIALGDSTRASTWARRGLAIYPNDAALRSVVGYVAAREGKWEDALLNITQAMVADWHGDRDRFRVAASTKVLALVKLDRPAEALFVLTSLLEQWPDRTDLHQLASQAIAQAEGRPEAVADCRKFVTRWPRFAQNVAR
jgi:O-antigen ligase